MTTSQYAEPFVDIVADLSRHLLPEVRYQRLLSTVRKTFPCDATALLRLEGDALIPLATDGLAEEARAGNLPWLIIPGLAVFCAAASRYAFLLIRLFPIPMTA